MKYSFEITAVVLCAGNGTRAGLGYNKILHSFGGMTTAARTAQKFQRFDRLIIVCAETDEGELKQLIPSAQFVRGGNTRTESVRNALNAIGQTDIVIIHDGARPFVSDSIIDKSITSAVNYGSGIASIKSVNAIKTVRDGQLVALDRDSTLIIQTPQTFRFEEIKKAYDTIQGDYADDSEVYQLAGYSPRPTDGSADNIKLTSYRDFAGLNEAYRVGFGFDVHPLTEGRKLILCGREFISDKGLAGHSDADAPIHALMDALLSAAGLPDIGVLFPDTDARYEGASSIGMLRTVREKLTDYEIINVSLCIMAQKPKISPYTAEMCGNIAAALQTDAAKISISATTTELLGIIGEEKGIAAAADVLIRLK